MTEKLQRLRERTDAILADCQALGSEEAVALAEQMVSTTRGMYLVARRRRALSGAKGIHAARRRIGRHCRASGASTPRRRGSRRPSASRAGPDDPDGEPDPGGLTALPPAAGACKGERP